MTRFGWESLLRADIFQKNLSKTFGLILILFVLLQVITYLSKFEIHLVERVKKEGVLVEYEYVDEDAEPKDTAGADADLDYNALDNQAQIQAQYNYRYRYSLDRQGRNRTGRGASEHGHNAKVADKYPNVTTVCSMQQRVAHLHKYCDRDKTLDDTFQHKDLIVDETHRVVYCSIPRVAATSWRTVMAKVSGKLASNISWPPVHNKGFMQGLGLKFLSQYDKPDANRVAKEYFKVIVVRNPVDRLVSAWRDKLVVRNAPSRWKLGSAVLAATRDEKHYETGREWNDTARFHEFVEYLADNSINNEEWNSYVTSCDVCMYKWDAILRTETAYNDSSVLLSKFPKYKDGLPFLHSHSSSKSDLHHIQKRLPELDKLSPKALEYIKYKYEADFEIFGYDWNSDKNMTRCAISTGDGDLCC